jgi:hypothetical protein
MVVDPDGHGMPVAFCFMKSANKEKIEFIYQQIKGKKVNTNCEIKKLANQKYLFCRIIFYGKTNINTYIVSKNYKINFLEQCSLDAIRTGRHVPLCHVLSSINIKGKKNYNTDLFYQIRNYFT